MCKARRLEVAKCSRGDRNLILNFVVVSLLLCLAGLTTACSSLPSQTGTGATTSPNSYSTGISLSPGSATLSSLQQLQFTARITGSANTAVTWSASAGTISNSGFFTAPKVTSNTPVTITAISTNKAIIISAPDMVSTSKVSGSGSPVSVSDPTTSAQASSTVTVIPQGTQDPPPGLAVSTTSLPATDASTAYTATLSATGGTMPYRWSLASGTLPTGIQLQGSSGIIAGTTSVTGSFPLTAKVTDASGGSATAALNLTVSSSGSGGSGFDGPAELPRIYINSAMSNTPASGHTTTVNAGGDLQTALNNANCGDTIQLQAGATFSGMFTFPAKNCDDNSWIIVRTSASDSLLPAEGTRMTPCYAGVSSLPGRPALHCTSTNNVLAKLVMTSYGNSGNGPILFAAGANHYRLMGLEITRATGIGIVYALASVAANGAANNLILDRVWMHGTAQDDTNRGVWLEGATYLSVVNSYLSDFHCVSVTGVCGDAQAIGGGLGSGPMGPYKINGNFLEASGENVMFGGGAATATPSDIEITQNHMFKPLTWMAGQPGYVGGTNGNPFVVKNLLELKNAQRVLVGGNIMEYSWGGFSQVGFAILLTPKNQASGTANVCPDCLVTDITIRNSTISHVGAGLQIANAMGGNGTGVARNGERYSIHDLVVDDINPTKYNGPGELAQISVSAGAPLLQNVTINHVTAFPPSTLFVVGDTVATSSQMKSFIFTNSLGNAGTYPIWSTGGGATNCAFYDIPLTTFVACFSDSIFSNNAIIGGSSAYPVTKWPAPNYFPASVANVQFVNYNGGIGGDYHLLPSSPYKAKGTDGKDLGADIDAINSAIAGVE